MTTNRCGALGIIVEHNVEAAMRDANVVGRVEERSGTLPSRDVIAAPPPARG